MACSTGTTGGSNRQRSLYTEPVDIQKGRAALDTPPAVAQEGYLPCTPDLIAALYAALTTLCGASDMPAKDTTHHASRAWPDVEAWLVDLEVENYAARTVKGYEMAVAPLLRAHPEHTPRDFTTEEIKRQLASVPSPSRHISKSIYNRLFDYWFVEGKIDGNPVGRIRKVRTVKEDAPPKVFPYPDVVKLEALPAPDGELWSLLFYAGLRRDEACNLRRRAIDLDGQRMTVVGKGRKTRVVELTTRLAGRIADLDLTERLGPDDYLWPRRRFAIGDRRRRGEALSSTTFSRWYSECIEAAGVTYRNPHQTRHTFHWIMRHVMGFDLELRQRQMGHASPVTTVRQYGVVDNEDVARALREWEEATA